MLREGDWHRPGPNRRLEKDWNLILIFIWKKSHVNSSLFYSIHFVLLNHVIYRKIYLFLFFSLKMPTTITIQSIREQIEKQQEECDRMIKELEELQKILRALEEEMDRIHIVKRGERTVGVWIDDSSISWEFHSFVTWIVDSFVEWNRNEIWPLYCPVSKLFSFIILFL